VSDDERGVDFAIAMYLEEGVWRADLVSIDDVETVDGLVTAMRQQAPEASEVLGMISVADDFFLMIRTNELSTRLLLSDATAASDWPLARSVLDELDVDEPGDGDGEHVEPVGDLAIVADLGLDAMELAALCDDLDLYPDEMLGSVASRLGFAEQFQVAIEESLA
jgi:putative tRNA adenosine deaminase-associated protein